MNNTKKIIKGLEVDPIIFEAGFVSYCDISKCAGECCNSGVWADIKEAEKILEYKDVVKKYMDDTQEKDHTKWLDGDYQDDADFPSGRCVGTQVFNNRCTFQRADGFCSLQSAGMFEGLGKWFLKPKYCVLFPVVVSEGVLTYDDSHSEDLHYCGTSCTQNHVSTVYDACTEELKYLLGEDGYTELDEYAKEYRKEHPVKKEITENKELVQITL